MLPGTGSKTSISSITSTRTGLPCSSTESIYDLLSVSSILENFLTFANKAVCAFVERSFKYFDNSLILVATS